LTKKPSPQISWFTPPGIGSNNGYGYAATEMIKALQAKEVNVPFQSNNLEYNRSTDAKCHISYAQPTMYQGQPDQYRIGFTCWESSKVPDAWIPRMQAMDEIWTPATWIAEIFESHNVNKTIRVVPHGFDPETWKITQRYPKDTFTFLHVGGPTGRKGGQKVVDAFLELFDGSDNVKLILKSQGSSECRVVIRGSFLNAGHHPQIKVIEENLTAEGLADVYAQADCLVYPTNGEGFGLIPFQGMVTGLPTIVTDATACRDFAQHGFPLRAKVAPGEGVHLGNWYDPDLSHLRELMLYVFENFDDAKEHAMHGAYILQASQTWGHVADTILNILGNKIYEKI
jgi:glycosyltransferase involved in cell wall biosynthesis